MSNNRRSTRRHLERHNTERSYDTYEYITDSVANLGEVEQLRIDPTRLRHLALFAFKLAGLLTVMPERPPFELYRALRVAANADHALLVLANAPEGQGREVFIGIGKPVVLPGLGGSSYASPSAWLSAFAGACIVREPTMNQDLMRIAPDAIKDERASPFLLDRVKAAQLLWRREAGAGAFIEETLARYGGPDEAGSEVPARFAAGWRSVSAPWLQMAHCLWSLDEPGFNDALFTALTRHREAAEADEEGMMRDPLHYIALGPLGLVCLAQTRGLEIEMESEYLPRYIVNYEFSN